MIQITGNMWQPATYRLISDAICITTNGYIKANGEAVMGRGCAAEAARLFPHLPRTLGEFIRRDGNVVSVLTGVNINHPQWLVSFPVKPQHRSCAPDKLNVVRHMRSKFSSGAMVPGWACIASLEIICRSAQQLKDLATENEWRTVILPRPGCGAGELKWENVCPTLSSILDDRFYVITRE